MIYYACRVHLQLPSFETYRISDHWRQLTQEIVQIDWFTWQIWQTIQIVSHDIKRTHVYSIEGRPRPIKAVGIARSCYMRLEHGNDRSTCTILSTEKEALESVRSLIENIYAEHTPVESVSLTTLIDQNETLPVQSARLYEKDRNCETVMTFAQPILLRELLDQDHPRELLSVSWLVNIKDPVKVRILYVSKADYQIGFSVETGLREEDGLIDKLFILADRTFKGSPIVGG